MRNKFVAIPFISIIVLQFHCSSIFPFKREITDYHNPRFLCNSEAGWRENAKFQKYIEIWSAVRIGYQQENLKIKQAKNVIIGNSLVHLFTQDLIEKEFPNQILVNRGIGGDMTETLLLRIEEDALVLSPQILIVEIGGNDLIQGKCLSYIQDNIYTLIQKVQARVPLIKIIFLSVPPTDVPHLNAIVPVYNSFLATLPKKYPFVTYLDTWNDMRDKDLPVIRRDFLREGGRDKIHFNEKGYSVWGKLLRPLL
jgi:lysophospholipase L1-like esterase